MSGIQINEAKAPWVMFERRAVEDRAASIREGRWVARDEDWAMITPHGSKDQVERVVGEWFEYLAQQVQEGRFDSEWLRKYKQAYEAWKDGQEIPLEGTPIINWSLASPAQVKMLQNLHILTVEVLANANEEVISRLGMGGRSLVAKAKEFLAQSSTGKNVEEVLQLRQLVEAQKTMLEAMNLQLQALKMGQGQTQAEGLTDSSPGISSDDLLERQPVETPTKTAGAKKL